MILNLNVLNSIYNDMTMSDHVCARVQSHTHTQPTHRDIKARGQPQYEPTAASEARVTDVTGDSYP